MLYREERFDRVALSVALQQLATHHDALRMTLTQAEDGSYAAWNRKVAGTVELYRLDVFDLRGEPGWSGRGRSRCF